MKIYLIRHGETAWNKQLKIQGVSNISLNDKGIEQANQIKTFFENISIDLIVSSSLDRAIQTASIVMGCSPDIIDDNFIERNFGALEGHSVNEYFEANDLLQIKSFESNEELLMRVKNGLINYTKCDYSNIAIFCHSHVLKAALMNIEPDKYDFNYKIKNCAILEIEYTNNNFTILNMH